MKVLNKILISATLASGLISPVIAQAADKPVLVSFQMTPDSVDATTGNAQVSFDLVVSNPTGISTQSTYVTLTDGANNSISTLLIRTDYPITPILPTVTFRGSIFIPANLPSGVYTASAKPITALNADGKDGYSTDTLFATSNSKVLGAEDALLVRQNGFLNFDYPTFVGPAYDKTKGYVFKDAKFNSVTAPIWKVGETVDVSKYYEMSVPALPLKLTANTSSVCTATGTVLKLIATGSCSFTVFTEKTNDYLAQKSEQVASVMSARTKPTLNVGTIATQDSSKLPLSIAGPYVYGPFGFINPDTATPTVCYPVGTYVTVISGGICILNYSTPESADYLASDVTQLKFEITRTNQTISFTLPQTMALSLTTFSLSATASSGQPVSYSSTTPVICSVNGSTLNLIKAGNCSIIATQAGTTTIAPASITQSVSLTGPVSASKKLICVMGKKTKVVLSKKCPIGFKVKM